MKKLLVLLVLVFVGVGVAAYWYNPRSRAPSDESYQLASVDFGVLTESVNATGILQPRELTAVGSELPGKVVKIYPDADYDKTVREGQPLLELDNRVAKLELDRAKSVVALAEADVQRAEAARDAAQVALKYQRELLKKEVGLQAEVDKAEYAVKAADAAINLARRKVDEARDAIRGAELKLEMLTVRAPAAGLVVDRKVNLGQVIGPPLSSQLFTIASDLARIQVNAQIAESDMGKVRVGQGVTFTVYAYTDDNMTFTGKIERINPVPASLPGSLSGAVFYNAIIDAANRREPRPGGDPGAWMLRPGMTANVEVRLREHRDVWKVPVAAVNFVLDEHYQSAEARRKLEEFHKAHKDADKWKPVWVLRDHKPWPVFVRVGGTTVAGEPGIKDGRFFEALEWDPDLVPRPDAKAPDTYPQLIISAPPPTKPGLFDRPTFKIS